MSLLRRHNPVSSLAGNSARKEKTLWIATLRKRFRNCVGVHSVSISLRSWLLWQRRDTPARVSRNSYDFSANSVVGCNERDGLSQILISSTRKSSSQHTDAGVG